MQKAHPSQNKHKALAISPLILSIVGAAVTASSHATQLEEVMVTAQKREQRAMDTPLSITAMDSSAMEKRQVDAFEDLQLVAPGVRSGHQNGVNRLFIRGIGLSSFASGADPSSAFHVDGIYVGRPSFQLTSFFDVDRLEVVRGPQGTLYGRNATGGAVNLLTKRPTEETSGYINLTMGDYDLHSAEGALSGALSTDKTILGRFAFNTLNRSGYGEDLAQHHDVNDANQNTFRATLQFLPSENMRATLIGEYHKEKDNNYYTAVWGPYPGAQLSGLSDITTPGGTLIPAGIAVLDQQDAASGLQGDTNDREASAVTALVDFDINDKVSVSSLTGWRKTERHNDSNSDGTSTGIGNTSYNEWTEQVTQELQLKYQDDKIDAIGGLYYYKENIDNFVDVPFIEFDSPHYTQNGSMDIDAYAVFGQVTYSIMSDLRVTGGFRYSDEERASSGYFQGIFVPVVILDDKKSWDSLDPKIGVEYDLGDNTMTYASFSKGFKSGSFNVGQNNPAIDPEEIDAYEIGFKSRLADNSIELTGAAFYYDYKDLQVNKIIGIATVTTNAATAKNKGVEMAVRAQLSDNLLVDANATYLDATFEEFFSVNPVNAAAGEEDLNGNMLPGASKKAAGAGIEYSYPVDGGASVIARMDASYNSQIFFSEFNDDALSQKSSTKVNATLRYESADGRWSLTAWGKNITDEKTYGNKVLGIGLWGLPVYASINAPATYGLTLGLEF